MRTRLSSWQVNELQGRDTMQYIEMKHTTVAHAGNGIVTYQIPFPEGVAGLIIKTIRITSLENSSFIVDLMDGNTNYSIYESLEETKFHYDNVDIPYKPIEQALFVRIHNKGSLTNKYEIDIRGIEVK